MFPKTNLALKVLTVSSALFFNIDLAIFPSLTASLTQRDENEFVNFPMDLPLNDTLSMLFSYHLWWSSEKYHVKLLLLSCLKSMLDHYH